MNRKRILVVGGGAAGLMAAIAAARNGAAVTVLEQNEKPGKKIGATGNGRCNFTNLLMPEDAYRGTYPQFSRRALEKFSVQDTVTFFSELGLYPVNKNNGYLYPHSGQASSVTELLCMEAHRLGVKLKTNARVCDIFRAKKSWTVKTEDWCYEGDAVILANGSCASAISGSDGSGYELVKKLGHKVVKPLPALTALKCKKTGFQAWAGVRTEGEITLYTDGKKTASDSGELQLTEYGVSGIPVFQVSRYAIRAFEEKKQVTLTLNFLPEFGQEQLIKFLEQRRKSTLYKDNKEFLVGLFPEKLSKVLLAEKDLEEAINRYPLKMTGYLPFEQAQICSGGVSTLEISAETMESLLHPGLYFAGELIDIDGKCGGYNLQWAWSSGYTAGVSAAEA